MDGIIDYKRYQIVTVNYESAKLRARVTIGEIRDHLKLQVLGIPSLIFNVSVPVSDDLPFKTKLSVMPQAWFDDEPCAYEFDPEATLQKLQAELQEAGVFFLKNAQTDAERSHCSARTEAHLTFVKECLSSHTTADVFYEQMGSRVGDFEAVEDTILSYRKQSGQENLHFAVESRINPLWVEFWTVVYPAIVERIKQDRNAE